MAIICYNSTGNEETNETIFDQTVIESIGIKIWHLVFMIFACAVIVTIVLCCLFRCRVPRTRQEIAASKARDQVTNQFRRHLEKLPYENLKLIDVLSQIRVLEEISIRSGEREEEQYTLWQRIKMWFRRSKKEANIENGSFEKQASIEMVKKSSQTSLNESVKSEFKS